jgi:hypothetical protein
LRSAPGAAAYAGPAYLKRLVERAAEAPADVQIDCGDDPGLAQAALRLGWRRVLFTGRPAVRAKLADIAAKRGGEVSGDRDSALDLVDHPDPETACRDYLAPARPGSAQVR